MIKNVRAALAVLAIASTLGLQGCLFNSTLDVISSGGEVLAISISFNGNWLSCVPTAAPGGGQEFNCAFFQPGNISTFTLTGPELLFFGFFIDPLIIQVPTSITNVHGAFTHAAGSGSLAVQGPLASVPIDTTRSLSAEPGMSLYIVSVPEAFEMANPNGTYGFQLGMNVPFGTTSFPAKAIIAGHVRTVSGQHYYPAVFPCVSSMAQAPGVTISTVGSSTVTLPSAASIPRCQGTQFVFGAAPPGAAADIPTLQTWALAALAVLIGLVTAAWSRRRALNR